MAEVHVPKKGNKLTLYIIICLFLGIGVGFWLNGNYVQDENKKIAAAEATVKSIKTQLKTITDTTATEYLALTADAKVQSKIKSETLEARDRSEERRVGKECRCRWS